MPSTCSNDVLVVAGNGPTRVPVEVLEAYGSNYGSPDLEPEFWEDYVALEKKLQQLLHTKNQIVIQSGEGMVILWGALKSIISPGDKVLAVSNGIYGSYFFSMAQDLGAVVTSVDFEFNQEINTGKVLETIKQEKPALVTMVHCETPTGCLNSLRDIGKTLHETRDDALFLVDFVSSALGTELHVDDEHIDVGLLGTQKVLSAPPTLGMATVSPRTWTVIEKVNFQGYSAFLPFKDAVKNRFMPYTHNWHGIAAASIACDLLLKETLEAVCERHKECREICINEGKKIGLRLFHEQSPSPTVTAFHVPENVTWEVLDAKLREKGVQFGGCYGDLKGKVFRVGHMGSQAQPPLVKEAMKKLKELL